MAVNCVGAFKNPWKDINEEAKNIAAWKWSPGTDSWQAVYGTDVTVVASLSQFLGLIEKQRLGSIQRINLLSHGSRGLIAFSGSIDAKTGNVKLDSTKALDLKIRETDPINVGGGKFQESFGAIAIRLRNRFSKGAEIVFYLCNSGVDRELLQAVADAFQVIAKGFSKNIWFCPEWSTARGRPNIDRSQTSLDKCQTKLKGTKDLIADVVLQPRAGR